MNRRMEEWEVEGWMEGKETRRKKGGREDR